MRPHASLLTHKDIFISFRQINWTRKPRASDRANSSWSLEGGGRAHPPARARAAVGRRAERQGPDAHPGPEPAAHQPAPQAAGRGRAGRARPGRQLGVLPPRRDRPGRRARPAGPGAHRPHRPADRARPAPRRGPAAASAQAAAQAYFQSHAGDWDSIRALHVAEAEVEAAVSERAGHRAVRSVRRPRHRHRAHARAVRARASGAASASI